jgi:hypothetical protein
VKIGRTIAASARPSRSACSASIAMIAVFVWALDEAGPGCPTRIDGFQNKIERSKGERWRTRGVVTPAAWITTMIKHTELLRQ